MAAAVRVPVDAPVGSIGLLIITLLGLVLLLRNGVGMA